MQLIQRRRVDRFIKYLVEYVSLLASVNCQLALQ